MLNNFFNKSVGHSKKREESAEVIRLPKVSNHMKDALVSKWFVQVGDDVKPGDVLAEVDTDKATMELESFAMGTILYQAVKEGEKVAVNGLLAIIGTQGEDIDHLINEKPQSFELGEELMYGVVGEVKMFAGRDIPKNWLSCDGSLYDKVEMSNLYKGIGNQYGVEGEKFRVPNLESLKGVVYIICYQ
ncbi:phage tail protein [Fulvivirga sediminis]|uniref:Tail fiber protein n=1 Tax=Fulvivirga sediminis TaxID=2803949 RepID=A0A937FDV6_9BACT|nr:phage tail protein [Fulvivirga sediminis]MBL3658954.1 tail fiber protein [Fulvivirga sediminis]